MKGPWSRMPVPPGQCWSAQRQLAILFELADSEGSIKFVRPPGGSNNILSSHLFVAELFALHHNQKIIDSENLTVKFMVSH